MKRSKSQRPGVLGAIAVVFALSLAMPGFALAQASAAPAAPPPPAAAGPVEAAPISGMKSLGKDRFQIGLIVVDKKQRRMTIPGRVLQLGVPLEYLAVSPHGMKGYESLLEVDASGSEFNLACILLGLDSSKATRPEMQFGAEPLTGQPVGFRIVWLDGKQRREISVPAAIPNATPPTKPACWSHSCTTLRQSCRIARAWA
jgi:hypothetical protein